MKKLNFERVSDNGDATSNYKVSINETMTLRELKEMVLSDKKEWGYIRIGKDWRSPNYIEYRRGRVIEDNRGEYSGNEVITSMKASGGWSRMDYYVEVEQ